MKKILTAALAAIACTMPALAVVSINPDDIRVSDLEVARNGNGLNVAFNVNARNLKLKSNEEITITPVITDGTESVELEPITVAGRNRVFYHLRNDGGAYTQGVNLFHNGDDAADINYSETIPYAQWMNVSELKLNYAEHGCANCKKKGLSALSVPLANVDMRPAFFEAEYVYVEPAADGIKTRQESGSANIDFKVNVMTINPDFGNNAVELNKIAQSIDKVKEDKDYTITSIFIKGYASPEGPYANNERLAKGRTEAVANYVKDLFRFPKSVKFQTAYEAEDWNGLAKWVAASDLEKKDAILALIDNDELTPDQKDARIKRDFPVDYPFLLENVYPSLRHTDYTVNYNVREFTDVNEIVSLVEMAPEKLGLNEFYLASQTFKPGSDQFNEVFETAVRMYPDDPVANLNAANSAMSKGDLESARKFLAKAGNSDQAYYARGIYDALRKDYTSAAANFKKAKSIPQARKALQQAEYSANRPEGKVILSPVNK